MGRHTQWNQNASAGVDLDGLLARLIIGRNHRRQLRSRNSISLRQLVKASAKAASASKIS